MKFLLLLMMLILLTVQVHAEAPNKQKVDSLNALLKTSIHDSVRADAFFQLAWQYWDDAPDKARSYANQCLALSERIGYKKGIADAYRVIGGLYEDKKDIIQEAFFRKKELQLRRELRDTTRIVNLLYSLGDKYRFLGDDIVSLAYNLESLKLNLIAGDKGQIAGLYNNIAITYNRIGNREEALQYWNEALKINTETGNNEWKAINLINIGSYYRSCNQADKSRKCYEEALHICRDFADKKLIAACLCGLGASQSLLGEYASGVANILAAAPIYREINDTNGVALVFHELGASYTQQKNYKQAALYLDSSLTLCKLLGPAALVNVYHRLYELDSASGNGAGAFMHHKLYIAMRDSVQNGEKATKIRQQKLRAEFEEKVAKEKEEQAKRDAVVEQELRQQKLVRNGFIGGFGIMLLFAGVFFFQRNRIANEKSKSDNLLLNILPHEVAEELKSKGTADAKHFDNVTVLFTDFKSFTTISEALTPQELVGELHACFKAFDEICTKYSIEKIKTIGDAYLAVCGLPLADEKHAENVVNAALEIREFMAKRSKELGAKTFEIRIGINSGSVVAGIVGVKKFAYDIWGDTVNTAARMEQHSEAGKINISEATYALVKDKFTCEYRGEIDAKNKGKLTMYFVEKA
ncbi:MAG: adenylate/guanylate cyclase domain-containing protein [Candidatus Kapaibacterium sp.]